MKNPLKCFTCYREQQDPKMYDGRPFCDYCFRVITESSLYRCSCGWVIRVTDEDKDFRNQFITARVREHCADYHHTP